MARAWTKIGFSNCSQAVFLAHARVLWIAYAHRFALLCAKFFFHLLSTVRRRCLTGLPVTDGRMPRLNYYKMTRVLFYSSILRFLLADREEFLFILMILLFFYLLKRSNEAFTPIGKRRVD